MFAKHGVPSTGDISWPVRTPRVSACDLFLLGYWKGKFMPTAPAEVLSVWTENS
jgi:hypothetical protein